MKKVNKVIKAIINRLTNQDIIFTDLTDVGNEVGIAIRSVVNSEKGNDMWDFNAGLEHGYSEIDDTIPTCPKCGKPANYYMGLSASKEKKWKCVDCDILITYLYMKSGAFDNLNLSKANKGVNG